MENKKRKAVIDRGKDSLANSIKTAGPGVITGASAAMMLVLMLFQVSM